MMAKPIKVAEKKLRDAHREIRDFIAKYGETSLGISAYFDIEFLRKAGKSNTIFRRRGGVLPETISY